MECRLDEHLEFTGKTSDQRKFSRSALAEAYVDKRVAGLGNISIPPYLCRREIKCSVGWIGGPLKVRTHPLPPPSLACVIQDLKVVVLQRTVVSRFECFVFEVWVLRFRVLGAPFSRFGCFVFEIWVLRFRDLGASFSRFGCSVFEIWVLRFRDFGASCFGLRFRVLCYRNYPLSCASCVTVHLMQIGFSQ